MLLDKPEGIGGFHRFMQPDMAECLLDHLDRRQRVVLNLQQRHIQFFSPADQLWQRFSSPVRIRHWVEASRAASWISVRSAPVTTAMLRRFRKNLLAEFTIHRSMLSVSTSSS